MGVAGGDNEKKPETGWRDASRRVVLHLRYRLYSFTLFATAISWLGIGIALHSVLRVGRLPPSNFVELIVVCNAPIFMIVVLPLSVLLHYLGLLDSRMPFSPPGLIVAMILCPLFWALYEKAVIHPHLRARDDDAESTRR